MVDSMVLKVSAEAMEAIIANDVMNDVDLIMAVCMCVYMCVMRCSLWDRWKLFLYDEKQRIKQKNQQH